MRAYLNKVGSNHLPGSNKSSFIFSIQKSNEKSATIAMLHFGLGLPGGPAAALNLQFMGSISIQFVFRLTHRQQQCSIAFYTWLSTTFRNTF